MEASSVNDVTLTARRALVPFRNCGLQHADEGGWRILKAVSDVLTVADAPVGNNGADSAQEGRVVLSWFGRRHLRAG
jgi:hypothetical protein